MRDTILLVIVSGDCKNTIIFAISLFFFMISFYILLTCFSQVALTKWMKKQLEKNRKK